MEVEIKDCNTEEKTSVIVCKAEENITPDSLEHEAVKIGDETDERVKHKNKCEDGPAKIEEDIIKSAGVERETGDTEISQLQTSEKDRETVSGDNKKLSSSEEKTAEDSDNYNTETRGEAEASSQKVCTDDVDDDEGKVEQPQLNMTEAAEEINQQSSISTASATKEDVTPTSEKEITRVKDRNEKKAELPRPRTIPKSYGRATKKDIAEKFGGVATSGVRVQRSSSCGAGAVKNMLLEWCRAKTRGREGVDIQNFSGSWSSGLAFCALILAFFPDEFDYNTLDPKNRRQNFQLAFSTAEKLADCPPLLDVEDMVRMKVPDSKCVYTYVQELYRSLVAKGLVKTKKA